MINARDITERKQAEEHLAHQAFHDGLTGLPNRVLFLDRLEHALTRAARRQAAAAVLFLDLDGFKAVNDGLGHDAGDELLLQVAHRLQGCLRAQDTVARLGGDEFTILLEEIGATRETTDLAERILTQLGRPLALRGKEVTVSASIGIAISGPGQASGADLLRDADMAMYRAKQTGKARYEVFDAGMSAAGRDGLETAADLRLALERGELTVYYQPHVELATGRLVGLEALVRWQHPERGLIAPAQFLPMAEQTGLIVPLGRWVLEEACRQGRVWQEQYPHHPGLTMSVNLSVREVQQADLVEAVSRIVRATGITPAQLKLEITESAVRGDILATSATLQQLKELGIQLVIDDFGTSFSSLNYLKQFPVDSLKIDRTFVARLGQDPEDAAILRAVVTLAHELGLGVVAEGVETAGQAAQLQALNCEEGQGYHFAKPLPAAQIERLLGRAGMTADGLLWTGGER